MKNGREMLVKHHRNLTNSKSLSSLIVKVFDKYLKIVGVSSGVSKKDIQSSFNNFTDKTRKLIQKVKEWFIKVVNN